MKDNKRTQVITIPNFIEVEDKFDSRIGLRSKQVIAVGRFCDDKNFVRLIQLWKKIEDVKPDWKLVLVGNGSDRKKIEEEIIKLKIKNIDLPGFLPNESVLQIMKNSRLFLMTSKSESFGIVIIEALKNSLPVIAFNCRVGPRSIIEDGKSGFLIDENSDEDFINKTLLLMNNEKMWNQFSSNAFIRAKDFSEEVVLQKWESILQ